MTKLWLIGAALLLALAGPAAAANVTSRELPTGYYGRYSEVTHHMRAQDFDHFDFGIARPTYPSGWGGPYGDGNYPGSIDRNMGPPYWGAR
jgi:opacity protein-like surface antigen